MVHRCPLSKDWKSQCSLEQKRNWPFPVTHRPLQGLVTSGAFIFHSFKSSLASTLELIDSLTAIKLDASLLIWFPFTVLLLFLWQLYFSTGCAVSFLMVHETVPLKKNTLNVKTPLCQYWKTVWPVTIHCICNLHIIKIKHSADCCKLH